MSSHLSISRENSSHSRANDCIASINYCPTAGETSRCELHKTSLGKCIFDTGASTPGKQFVVRHVELILVDDSPPTWFHRVSARLLVVVRAKTLRQAFLGHLKVMPNVVVVIEDNLRANQFSSHSFEQNC
jgi:hypothetical protein